jgi:hypothetical protein
VNTHDRRLLRIAPGSEATAKDGTVSLVVVDSRPRTVSALAGAAGLGRPRVSGQSSETVMVTSMLPRVAFEYGHTW